MGQLRRSATRWSGCWSACTPRRGTGTPSATRRPSPARCGGAKGAPPALACPPERPLEGTRRTTPGAFQGLFGVIREPQLRTLPECQTLPFAYQSLYACPGNRLLIDLEMMRQPKRDAARFTVAVPGATA